LEVLVKLVWRLDNGRLHKTILSWNYSIMKHEDRGLWPDRHQTLSLRCGEGPAGLLFRGERLSERGSQAFGFGRRRLG
jgi:hypothetical protein